MKYSQTEEVDDRRRDPAPDPARGAARATGAADPLEIASVADVPAGTGMGSSGAFTVCLLKALAQARSTSITPGGAGRGRMRDRDRHPQGAGRQAGQYVAAHGGICAYTFNPDGTVDVEPLELGAETLRHAARATCCSSTPARRATRRRCSATRTTRSEERRRGDAREPAPHQGDGLPSRDCCSPATSRLRRADARALAEQAPALAGHGARATSTSCTRWRAAAARSAASWSAPAAAASCSSTRGGPPTRARRWPRRARSELVVRLRVRGRERDRVP